MELNWVWLEQGKGGSLRRITPSTEPSPPPTAAADETADSTPALPTSARLPQAIRMEGSKS